MSLRRRRKEDFWLSTLSKAGKLRILRFFSCVALRQAAFVQLFRRRERDRRLHFNLSLRHFPFRVVRCRRCRRRKANGNIASGRQKMASHIAARFLPSLFLSCTLSLAACRGEKGEDWRRARVRSPPKAAMRASDVCPMIALSFTALP